MGDFRSGRSGWQLRLSSLSKSGRARARGTLDIWRRW